MNSNSAINTPPYDVVVVGAGVAGLYMLYRLRNLGFSVRVLEAADDVGGTWYWNRYPGARCDVPSIEYSYGFSEELQQEWNWSESMAGQPEILSYLNHVTDRFDLRSDIDFNTRVEQVHYNDVECNWLITTQRGEQLVAKFCVMATGCLSAPNKPDISGAESFAGNVYHTGLWPHSPVDFSGQRVGIIGTGSSAVQAIPVIAEQAEHLLVFQRTPVYTFPANNRPLTADFVEDVKQHYAEIRATQRNSYGGFSGYPLSPPDNQSLKSIKDASADELEGLFKQKGFGVFQAFSDVYTDLDANEIACDLYRQHVARIVDDPVTAQALMPRDYPLGCKRQVLDSHFYEAFNRDNVTLVELQSEPLQQITPAGIQTTTTAYTFDTLIYATGFDAMTGALKRIDIRGRNGDTLRDKWLHGPRSYLGLQVHGFPNLFTITGPGSPSVLSNMMVSIEQHVEWISDCLAHLREQNIQSIEADQTAEEAWAVEVNRVAENTMFTAPSCNSWYLGANIPGKPRMFMPYVGGFSNYVRKCDTVVSEGYSGFKLDPASH